MSDPKAPGQVPQEPDAQITQLWARSTESFTNLMRTLDSLAQEAASTPSLPKEATTPVRRAIESFVDLRSQCSKTVDQAELFRLQQFRPTQVEAIIRRTRQLEAQINETIARATAILMELETDRRDAQVTVPRDTSARLGTQVSNLPSLTYFLLHFFLPRRDREIVERHLEDQFQDEAFDPLLGDTRARMLYRQRAAEAILWYGWELLPKRLRHAITATLIAWCLKTLGLLPTLDALRNLGSLLHK